MRKSYETLPSLKHYYLEDSYVLDVKEDARSVGFRMDIVLTPTHPYYRSPLPHEQHCYRRGRLIFQDCDEIVWKRRNFRPSTDASGEVDYGNIDSLYEEDGYFHLNGDWGELVLKAPAPTVVLEDE